MVCRQGESGQGTDPSAILEEVGLPQPTVKSSHHLRETGTADRESRAG